QFSESMLVQLDCLMIPSSATELAPAEREDRMKRQAERLRGLSLEGELECGYAGYDTVMKMLQDNAALTRRALCLDLVGYRQVDVVQILKADQRAWLRLSEMVKSGLLETDPQVCFQLLPSGAAPKRERPAESPSESRPSKKSGKLEQDFLMPPAVKPVPPIATLPVGSRRKGILRSAQSSGDPDLDKAVYDSTEEELRKGWLWGPDNPRRVLAAKAWDLRRELCGAIDTVLEAGVLSAGDGASLRGRLIFAENQIFGHSGNVVCWFERVNTASNIADKPSRGDDDLTGLGERMHLDISNLISE
ncbi:unnamed protein product, partial [Effrenium voratum]